MTTFANRPSTALLVVDLQNAVLDGAHERDAVLGRVAELVERARSERVPVVWVQHSDDHIVLGSEGWRIVSELAPGEDEPIIHKEYGDAFEDTTLATELEASASGGSSLPARRPTPASARRCTGRWSAATTRPWSATRTRPQTRPSGARRRPLR